MISKLIYVSSGVNKKMIKRTPINFLSFNFLRRGSYPNLVTIPSPTPKWQALEDTFKKSQIRIFGLFSTAKHLLGTVFYSGH